MSSTNKEINDHTRLKLETERNTGNSPYSSKDGRYIREYEKDTIKKLTQAAKKCLENNRWVVPLIPEQTINQAVSWFTELFINEISNQKKDITLKEFRKSAKEYILIYNLQGAKWFKKKFATEFLKQLREKFHNKNINSLRSTGLQAIKVRATTSTGETTFADKVSFEIWDADSIKDKIVISFDDLGDTGRTQEAIEKRARQDGAKDFISVNMYEKAVPDNVDEKHQKIASPSIYLLLIAYYFLIGAGLNGNSEQNRDFPVPGALYFSEKDIPEGELAFRGGLPATKD